MVAKIYINSWTKQAHFTRPSNSNFHLRITYSWALCLELKGSQFVTDPNELPPTPLLQEHSIQYCSENKKDMFSRGWLWKTDKQVVFPSLSPWLQKRKCRQGHCQSKQHTKTWTLIIQIKSDAIQNTFLVTYHADLPKIQDIVDKIWQTIKTNTKLNRIFPMKPMMAFRRPKSLKGIIVRAKVKPRQDSPKGEPRPCNKSRCQRLVPFAHTFKYRSGTYSAIKWRHTCKTSNAVYLMTCNVCNKQYVGETSMALNKWMHQHRSDCKNRKFNRSPVAAHFNKSHSF